MAKYKLRSGPGVEDLESGEIITSNTPKWEEYMKWFRDGNIPEPPDMPPIVEPTLEGLKKAKVAEIDRFAASLRNRFLSNVSPAEMASWGIKETLAKKYVETGGTSDPSLLATEALVRGVPLSVLIQKILTKAALYYQLEATICGLNGKHNDIVNGLDNKDEVVNYNYQSGWPQP